MIRLLQILSLAAMCGLFAGCTAYKLGLPDEAESGTIFIAPVRNETMVPQVRALLTEQLRRQFSQGAAWRLAPEDAAEFRLEVVLTESSQKVAATRSEDTARGVSFESRLVASVRLISSTGEPVELEPIEVYGLLFDVPGQPEVAYQALPGVTQKLAEQIYRKVTLR